MTCPQKPNPVFQKRRMQTQMRLRRSRSLLVTRFAQIGLMRRQALCYQQRIRALSQCSRRSHRC